MKYHLLIINFTFFFFSAKILAYGDRIMEVLEMSIYGNSNVRSYLCKTVQSQIFIANSSDVLFTICLVEKVNLSETKDRFCKSSKIIFDKINCINTLLRQLNDNSTILQSFYLNLKVRNRFFIILKWNNWGGQLSTKEIEIDKRIFLINTKRLEMSISNNRKMKMTLKYRSRCPSNYYGSDCENFCEAMDNHLGHYNCSEKGRFICLPGWRGLFCTEPICSGCFNGQCLAPDKCKCYSGWSGTTCNSCEKASGCKHGTCNGTVGVPYTCVCKPGWGGQHCDIDLTHCIKQRSLCQNNGICHNYYGDSRIRYICQCAPGFFGRHCEIKTGNCTYSNEGPKNDLTSYKCSCYLGFSGSYCQINDKLQLKFPLLRKNVKTGGFCTNSEKGFSCFCSRPKLQMCQCKFIKCSSDSSCIERKKNYISCYGNKTVFVMSSNFGFDKYSPLVISKIITADNKVSRDSYLKFYMSSLFFIPILFTVLVLVTIIFRIQFHNKPKSCIKTIHNDLGLPNNTMLRPVQFHEHNFLFHQVSLSNLKSEKYVNSFKTQNNTIDAIKNKDFWKIDESEYIDRSRVLGSMKKSSYDQNLLINHYKDVDGNV